MPRSERVDDALRLDKVGAGAFGVELRGPHPVAGAGKGQDVGIDTGLPLVGHQAGLLAELAHLLLEPEQAFHDLRFAESLDHRAGS
jgi:hypothetical protein